MVNRAKNFWLNLTQTLGFVPAAVVFLFAALGIGLVDLDGHLQLDGAEFVFKGDGSAARTVLSVIAGSLITVAGLTFSITMVVLQLASSQFSPRILRTFFGDRITQVTIGTYVGIFVYSILVLRAVGSVDQSGFVPRLSVTVASLLGIAAVVLLIGFLHHVSQLVQVSQVTAKLARASLRKVDQLYPTGSAEVELDGPTEITSFPEPVGAFGVIRTPRPGYVQRVSIDDLLRNLGSEVHRAQILVCPGDFVSVETVLVRVWPARASDTSERAGLAAFSIASERDLDQDVDFGLRQLTDIALKALSPGINDPMTAVTCIGYLRSVMVRLTERPDLPTVLSSDETDLQLMVRRRAYGEYLSSSFLQINRYVAGDAWVAGEILLALTACATAARRGRFRRRLEALGQAAEEVVERSSAEAATSADRRRVNELHSAFQQAVDGSDRTGPMGESS